MRDPSLHLLSILGYILIYLTTCINPIIYVLMSSEYRQVAGTGTEAETENIDTDRKQGQRQKIGAETENEGIDRKQG